MQQTTKGVYVDLKDIRNNRKAWAWVGVAVSLLGTAGFGAWALQHPDWKLQYMLLTSLVSLCINLAAASIIYLVVQYTFIRGLNDAERKSEDSETLTELERLFQDSQKGLAIVGILEHQDIYTVEWNPMIESATTIDICVQGWHNWVDQRRTSWVKFFTNEGKLNLIVPNPDNVPLMRLIEERLGREPGDQKKDIENMCKLLAELCSGTKGDFRARVVNRMMWYCAVRFDDEEVFLSLYEHIRFSGHKIESPTYQVLLAKHGHTDKWMKKEFDGLMSPQHSSPFLGPGLTNPETEGA